MTGPWVGLALIVVVRHPYIEALLEEEWVRAKPRPLRLLSTPSSFIVIPSALRPSSNSPSAVICSFPLPSLCAAPLVPLCTFPLGPRCTLILVI